MKNNLKKSGLGDTWEVHIINQTRILNQIKAELKILNRKENIKISLLAEILKKRGE